MQPVSHSYIQGYLEYFQNSKVAIFQSYMEGIPKDSDALSTTPQAAKLIVSKTDRERGQKLLDLLILKMQKIAELFLVKNLNELALLNVEQTINLGYVCIWIKVNNAKKIEVTAVKILIAIQQRKWSYENGHEELVNEFARVEQKAFSEELSLIKPLTSLPQNYAYTWIKQFKPCQEGHQALNQIFMNFLLSTLPIFQPGNQHTLSRVVRCRRYCKTLHEVVLKNEKNRLGYFSKAAKIYKIILDNLLAIQNLSVLHQIKVQKFLKENALRFTIFWDVAEICRHINEINQISLNFIKWSYLFSPISATTPSVAKDFIAQYHTDIQQLKCNFFESLVNVIEKFISDKKFPDFKLTTQDQKKLQKLVAEIIALLIKAIEAYEKKSSFEEVDKEYATFVKSQDANLAPFIAELYEAVKKGLEEFAKHFKVLVRKYDDICPSDQPQTINEQEVNKEIAAFKKFLEISFSDFKEGTADSTKQQILFPLYATFCAALAAVSAEKIKKPNRKDFFSNHDLESQVAHQKLISADVLKVLNAAGEIESRELLQQEELFQPLYAVSSLISELFNPILTNYEDTLKLGNDVSEEMGEALFYDLTELQAGTQEAEEKMEAQQCEEVTSLFNSAVCQHAIACGWNMGSFSMPRDMCNRSISSVKLSKHEFLHALHSFQLVHQMLVQSEDEVAKRALAVRFMHQGYLALEQCMRVVSTQPKHHLTKMMKKAGVNLDCLWTKHADRGTFVARYPGYDFTNTLPIQQVVENILKNNEKWVSDFHDLLALILEKDTKFTSIQRVKEIFKKFQKHEKLDNEPWSPQDLLQLASLNEKAENLEKMRKQISEMNGKLKISNNYADRQMAKRLICIDHHIKMLNEWLTVIKNFSGPQFMLQHIQEALLHALYLADNLGTYLALSKRKVDYRDAYHYLGVFRHSYGLGAGLKPEQMAVLDYISNIGKGCELPYTYFTLRNSEKEASKTMIMLSELFNISRQLLWHGKILKQQNISKDSFWKHLKELFDLSETLVKNHLTA